MTQVGFAYDDVFLTHDTGPGHPERPERLRAIVDRLGQDGWDDKLTPIAWEPAQRAVLERLHTPQYIDRLVGACAGGRPFIDVPDSMICAASQGVARQAVGAVLAACDAVVAGGVDRAFCAVRPPGHHAEADRSMGFCLYNNVALATDHLLRTHALQRVAVVDFDVHHGNGTQHLFEARDDVLFISLHEDPRQQYPGTGFASERGVGAGEGFTLNIPLASGAGDAAVRAAFDEQVLPALDRFGPQALLLSAGFDAAAADPLGGLRVSTEAYGWLTRQLVEAAKRHAAGRIVSVLEGGYDLDALAAAVSAHVAGLLGRP